MDSAQKGKAPKDEPAPSRPAATVLLVRDGDTGMEVFMVVRHHEIDFATGALVFPGGKVDPGDSSPELVGRCVGADGITGDGLITRIAAIRESFEECGVLLARGDNGAMIDGVRAKALRDAYQQQVLDQKITLLELAEAEDIHYDIGALLPFAHWVTPPLSPKRFDTYFYIAATPPGQVAEHDGAESVDSVWITATQALADAEAGTRTVVFPTKRNLEKLDRDKNVKTVLERARTEPVVTVRPNVTRDDRGLTVKIPENAGYAITEHFIPKEDQNIVPKK